MWRDLVLRRKVAGCLTCQTHTGEETPLSIQQNDFWTSRSDGLDECIWNSHCITLLRLHWDKLLAWPWNRAPLCNQEILYGFTFHSKKKYQKLEPENIWNFILVHGQILQHQWFKPGIEYELN